MAVVSCSALLFDLDGVLVDSTPAVTRVWGRWAFEHGFDRNTVVKIAHGRPSRTTIRELLPNADIDREDRLVAMKPRGARRKKSSAHQNTRPSGMGTWENDLIMKRPEMPQAGQ